MEQQQLRDMEKRCIQEEPPYCQAACPLHVDMREVAKRAKTGDFDGARKVLEKTLPLPAVFGSICDHPCEAACKRGQAGEAVGIGELERAVIRHGRPAPKPLVLPSKGKKAAVFGTGLSTLVCAWDLIRKGFGVHLFCPDAVLGGWLLELPETRLPKDNLNHELGRLTAMGVLVECGRSISQDNISAALADFDAVFVEASMPGCPPSRELVDEMSLSAGVDKLFAGGWREAAGGISAMNQAADGRRAASSMDRFMSGASLTASREREGAFATRLFTSLKGIAPSARQRASDADLGYTQDEAAAEAARCLHCECLECLKVCSYLRHYQGYPKKYARQIYNNAAIVQGVHQANKMINSCALCGLCTEVCPEGFSMTELCRGMRQDMVSRGKMPPSAHEFALDDMAFNNGPDFSLTKAAPGEAACEYVFFPGCQLSASHPHHVASVYDYLRGKLGSVGLMLRCCGIAATWAGRDEVFEKSCEQLVTEIRKLGSPKIVTACASCLSVLREHLPELSVSSLWEVFEQAGQPTPQGVKPPHPVALHDPCTSRHAPDFQQGVRRALAAAKVPFEELPLTGLFTQCCGYGGLVGNANPEISRKMAQDAASQSPLDYAASCSMCRDRFVSVGKRSWHVLDFLFPAADDDPAALGPGFSLRHEARARLKAGLLKEVWKEELPMDESLRGRLRIPPEVLDVMEKRRILLEDVEAAIALAEQSGRTLVDAASGRILASHRPRRVSYWVEYSKEGQDIIVHRAWCHRMQVFAPGTGANSEEHKA